MEKRRNILEFEPEVRFHKLSKTKLLKYLYRRIDLTLEFLKGVSLVGISTMIIADKFHLDHIPFLS